MGFCPSKELNCPLRSDYYVWPGMRLLPLGGDPESITFSGWSSGAYMAHLMHIVHSDTIKGVGLMEGGPYGSSYYDMEDTN